MVGKAAWGPGGLGARRLGGSAVRWLGGAAVRRLGRLAARPIGGAGGSALRLMSNTFPLIILLCLLAGSRANSWAVVLYIVLLGGALLWMLGRPATHIGASGLVYGLIAFLLLSGIFERRFVPLAISLLVGFLFGATLLSGILPTVGSRVSWDGHPMASGAHSPSWRPCAPAA